MKHVKYIASGEGENYNYSQDHCYIKLSSRDTNGELCIVEDTLKPGFHLKRHHHKVMTEVFYMLVGEMKLIFDDETLISLKKVIPLQFHQIFGTKPNVRMGEKC